MSASTTLTPRELRAERWRLRARGYREGWRRYRRRPDGVIGLVILVIFSALAIAPTLFVGPLQTATTATGASLQPPSLAYPFGTDELGRSILNLTVHGTRVSMFIGLLATVITVVIGAVLGIISG
jgi:peptide/nickel transport system permease protein